MPHARPCSFARAGVKRIGEPHGPHRIELLVEPLSDSVVQLRTPLQTARAALPGATQGELDQPPSDPRSPLAFDHEQVVQQDDGPGGDAAERPVEIGEPHHTPIVPCRDQLAAVAGRDESPEELADRGDIRSLDSIEALVIREEREDALELVRRHGPDDGSLVFGIRVPHLGRSPNTGGHLLAHLAFVELGIYSFGERTPDPRTGRTISAEERIRRLLEEIELADQVGLDVFGVGEHHRSEFVVSTPAVVLAAAATRTKRIRLTSAVTVLSSDDPVRVFQDFATLDLISGGRAEIMAGRGSFTESFPLFGYDLADYDDLFEEKLGLLLRIRESERVSWRGTHRAPIEDLPVFPRPVQDPLPLWIAVGGHPESVVRAGRLGLPLALAIIGGEPRRFVPLVDLYREAGRRARHDPPGMGRSHKPPGPLPDDSPRKGHD